MFEDIDINNVKNYLKSLSKNYEENFLKIENFIKSEVDKIQKLKNSQKAVIPEIDFSRLDQSNIDFIENVKKRGCLIIRNVFEDKAIFELNTQLEKYIDENNYYKDQQKKSDLDKYFSDLKSAKPQIYGLYWSCLLYTSPSPRDFG